MTLVVDIARIRAEVREIQKAAAVHTCIQCAAEYNNEVEADLADAVSVVRALIIAVAARTDGVLQRRKSGHRG